MCSRRTAVIGRESVRAAARNVKREGFVRKRRGSASRIVRRRVPNPPSPRATRAVRITAMDLILRSSSPSSSPPVVGMLHLPPLPGSARHALTVPQVTAHALRDAEALAEGGVHGFMLENFGDVPFYP